MAGRIRIGVDEPQERVEGAVEGAGRDPHDPARLVRPPQVAGGDVPLPAPDVSDPLRVFQVAV